MYPMDEITIGKLKSSVNRLFDVLICLLALMVCIKCVYVVNFLRFANSNWKISTYVRKETLDLLNFQSKHL